MQAFSGDGVSAIISVSHICHVGHVAKKKKFLVSWGGDGREKREISSSLLPSFHFQPNSHPLGRTFLSPQPSDPLLFKSKMATIAFTHPKNTPALQATGMITFQQIIINTLQIQRNYL